MAVRSVPSTSLRDRLFPKQDVYFYPGGRYGSPITMMLALVALGFAGVVIGLALFQSLG